MWRMACGLWRRGPPGSAMSGTPWPPGRGGSGAACATRRSTGRPARERVARRSAQLARRWAEWPSVPDSRVEHRIEEVDGQVGKADQRRVSGEHTHCDVVVPVEDAGHELLAQPRDTEDVLDHDAAGDDADHQRSKDCDDGDQGVPQSVPNDDDLLDKPFGA